MMDNTTPSPNNKVNGKGPSDAGDPLTAGDPFTALTGTDKPVDPDPNSLPV